MNINTVLNHDFPSVYMICVRRVCSLLMNGTWMNSILKWKIDLWYLLFMHDIQLHSIGLSLLLHLIVLSANIYKLLSSPNFRRIRKNPVGIAVSLALSLHLSISLSDQQSCGILTFMGFGLIYYRNTHTNIYSIQLFATSIDMACIWLCPFHLTSRVYALKTAE